MWTLFADFEFYDDEKYGDIRPVDRNISKLLKIRSTHTNTHTQAQENKMANLRKLSEKRHLLPRQKKK